MKGPEITLVLPMYSVRQYICNCLTSIYVQPDAERIEVILVDDGSPDDSADVAKLWLKANTNLNNWSIIRQENRGLGGARNTGLQAANAPYVWFIDTDDEIATDSLSFILSRLGRNKDVFVFSYRTNPFSIIKKVTEPILDIEAAELTGKVNFWCAPFNVYKAAFLKEHHLFFREKFLHEDNEFTVRLIGERPRMDYFPEEVYIYNFRNQGSINNTVSLKALRDSMEHLASCEEMISRKKDLPDYVVRAMHQTCGVVLATVFRRSLLLSDSDWQLFKKGLQNKKWLIKQTQTDQPFSMRCFNLLLATIKNRQLYKAAFAIKKILHK